MPNWQTKSLVEGAFLAAITVILSIISIYVPFLNVFATLICPVPIVVLAVRHGWKLSAAAAVVASLVVTIISGPVNGIVTLFTVGLVGSALGTGFRKGYSPARILLIGAIAGLIAQFVLVGIYAIAFRANIIYDTLRLMAESSQQSGEIIQQLGGFLGKFSNPQSLEQLEQQVARQQQQMAYALEIMWRIIPVAFFILPSIFGSFLNFTISRLVLNKLGYKFEGLPPFKNWTMPPWTVWGFLAGIMLMWWGEKLAYPWITTIGLNLNMLFTLAYAVQGAAVIWFALEHYKVNRVIRLLVVVYMFVLMQFLTYIGLFDGIFDFRRRMLARKNKA
ncbi:MAG TPA: YybS family protein [Clostridia bacterium]|jgi:uncharacterized protein YybS (DUF2232 family)|nr:YybS family protein [Clostridia bacterium]